MSDDNAVPSPWTGLEETARTLAQQEPGHSPEEQGEYRRNLGWLLSEAVTAADAIRIQHPPTGRAVTGRVPGTPAPGELREVPTAWAGVGGTSARSTVTGRARNAAEQIGNALADAGVGLVTGGSGGIDAIVTLAYAARLASHFPERRAADFIRHHPNPFFKQESYSLPGTVEQIDQARPRGQDASLFSPESAYSLQAQKFFDLARTLILIQGGNGTRQWADQARRHEVVVLPVIGTGGMAQRLVEQFRQEDYGKDLPEDLSAEYQRLLNTPDASGIAAFAKAVGERGVRLPDPFPSAPKLRIAVRGFTNLGDLPGEATALPKQLGRELAKANIGLNVGGWGGVRTEVVDAYVAALPDSASPSRNGPRVYLATDELPHVSLSDQVQLQSTEDRDGETLKDSAALVVIGGGAGTRDLIARARTEDGPVLIPLPGTGGVAGSLIASLGEEIDWSKVPEPWREDYRSLLTVPTPDRTVSGEEVIARLIALLTKIGEQPRRMGVLLRKDQKPPDDPVRARLSEAEKVDIDRQVEQAVERDRQQRERVLIDWHARGGLPSPGGLPGKTLEIHFEEAHTPQADDSGLPRYAAIARLLGGEAQARNGGRPPQWSVPAFPDPEHPITGGALYRTVFQATQPEVEDGKTLPGLEAAFREAYGATKDRDERLHIQVVMRPDAAPALQDMPWEKLEFPDEAGKRPLASNPNTPFSRTLPLSDHVIRPATLRAGEKIRLLIALAAPHDVDTFEGMNLAKVDPTDAEGVATFLRRYASKTLDVTVFGAKEGEWASLEKIAELLDTAALDKTPFHALHLICHGLPGSVRDQRTALVLPDAHGKAERVGDARFAEVIGKPERIRENGGPWVVTLASCWTAHEDAGHGLKGIGRRLLLGGVPVVAAMQSRVQMTTAEVFARSFYLNLAKTGLPDVAMNAARGQLYTDIKASGGDPSTDPSWWQPVLFQMYDRSPIFRRANDLDEHARTAMDYAREEIEANPAPPPIPYEKIADPRVSASVMASRIAPAFSGLPMGLASAVPGMPGVSGTGAAAEAALASSGSVRAFLETALTRRAEDAAAVASPNVYTTEHDNKLLNLAGFRSKEDISSELDLPAEVVRQLVVALESGRHVILTGPPGTGKTTLAIEVAQYAMRHHYCAEPKVVTASVDWTTFDTLGGNIPTESGALRFRAGIVPKAVEEGRWLILDEINRADIDKAFGEMFTLLADEPVELPFDVAGRPVRLVPPGKKRTDPGTDLGHDYQLHKHWRIIGTMNVYDRASLFAMSAALKRRFAFVNVPLPLSDQYKGIIEKHVNKAFDDRKLTFQRKLLVEQLHTLLLKDEVIARCRSIGPALSRDIARYLAGSYGRVPRHEGELSEDEVKRALADVVALFLLPQWEGLEPGRVEDLAMALHKFLPGHSKRICLVLQDMYPFLEDRILLRQSRDSKEEVPDDVAEAEVVAVSDNDSTPAG